MWLFSKYGHFSAPSVPARETEGAANLLIQTGLWYVSGYAATLKPTQEPVSRLPWGGREIKFRRCRQGADCACRIFVDVGQAGLVDGPRDMP